MAANPKTSKLAAALNYLHMRGQATPDDYQERLGLQGDVTPSMSTVTQAARDFGGGVATNLGNRARDIAPIIMETVDPRPLQARPATVKMLGDVASIGKAIVTDPIGTGKLIVSGEAERAKLAMNNPRSMGEYTGSFIDPLRIASALRKRPSIAELDVYHGTPHNFPPTENNPLGEFDASKIGTGEGMQAYGHGHYLAESEDLAKDYAYRLTDVRGGPLIMDNTSMISRPRHGSVDDALNSNAEYLNYLKNKAAAGNINAKNSIPVIQKAIEELKKKTNVYKVDLPDEQIAKMLDWHKPLSKQSKTIKKLMGSRYEDYKNSSGQDLYEILSEKLGGDKAASEWLRENNIPGISYLDETSRYTGKGTRNFVVFPDEEKKVRILERK